MRGRGERTQGSRSRTDRADEEALALAASVQISKLASQKALNRHLHHAFCCQSSYFRANFKLISRAFTHVLLQGRFSILFPPQHAHTHIAGLRPIRLSESIPSVAGTHRWPRLVKKTLLELSSESWKEKPARAAPSCIHRRLIFEHAVHFSRRSARPGLRPGSAAAFCSNLYLHTAPLSARIADWYMCTKFYATR